MQEWKIGEEEELFSCRIMKVTGCKATNPRNGFERDYFRAHYPDWVNVLAITENDELLLIRQFRHGSRKVEHEIPGGCIDPGEEPVTAGMRELLEETGFSGDNPQLIGQTSPNPAIQGNICYTVLTTNARKIQEPEMEDGEDIAFELIPMKEVPEAVKDGRISNSMVVAGLYMYEKLEIR